MPSRITASARWATPSNADIFLGCSGPGVLTQDMVKTMARDPLIMALANPEPEILPPLAKAVRPDAIICTGRSDYPNQVNNVLCFPFIFRGALDVGATTINEEMKLACVHAIADLALAGRATWWLPPMMTRISPSARRHHSKPFDPRLIVKIAPAVAKAAMDSGVATRPIEDFDAYVEKLAEFVYKTNLFMKPIFSQARKRGEAGGAGGRRGEERVLHATQELVSQGAGFPDPGRPPERDRDAPEKLGLQLTPGKDFRSGEQRVGPALQRILRESTARS